MASYKEQIFFKLKTQVYPYKKKVAFYEYYSRID